MDSRKLDSWMLVFLGMGVSLLAITTQSYWLDEAGTAYKAGLTSLRDWWVAMRSEGNSNLQLPLYMFYAWLWQKVVGSGEFALRLANVPWVLAGLGTMAAALPQRSLRWSVGLLVLASPFIWYYLDDARPYGVQVGCSLIVVASLFRLGSEIGQPGERRWSILLALGAVLLAGSGMLAMIWLGAFLCAALLSTSLRSLRELLKRQVVVWLSLFACLLVIGVYYLWTLSLGARASAVGGTDLRNALFICYELLGFSGVGPGRLEIRTGGLRVFLPWLPLIGAYALLLAGILVPAAHCLLSRHRRMLIWWGLGCGGVFLFLLAVGVTVHFRLLGRHCAPMIAPLLMVLGLGVSELWMSRSMLKRGIVTAFVALSLVSCLGIRFGARHAKDDYRGAAAVARRALAQGKIVWWNADSQGALVYGVRLSEMPAPDAVLFLYPVPEHLENLPEPDVVVASKPDVYDSSGVLGAFLKRGGFEPDDVRIVAFTIWQKPDRKTR